MPIVHEGPTGNIVVIYHPFGRRRALLPKASRAAWHGPRAFGQFPSRMKHGFCREGRSPPFSGGFVQLPLRWGGSARRPREVLLG